jgi:RNA polymerase sigma-70 factor (ECF subfamily)
MKGSPDNVMDKADFTCRVLNAENSLYRVAKAILIDDGDCQDAVQETRLRAWEKRDSLRQPEYFQTWMTRILINECKRLARKRPDTVALEECGELTAPEGGSVDRELRESILGLPRKLRTAVVLYYIEGYSVQETARLTRVPAGTVKSRLSKARSLLRVRLIDSDNGGNYETV